ncbi:MAG TPA: M20/M25/M40 family metallo-hydrolase [Candidatus Acidoferrales bacterium]|nr:M20/M25/M40 family metallo-hydrolase [Candidatus Acidoferrales bacterium]
MNRRAAVSVLAFVLFLVMIPSVGAQTEDVTPSGAPPTLAEFVATPAVSGYEGQLEKEISSSIEKWRPRTDTLGDVIVTIGSGSPHRLIVTPIDEPGFVVSDVTPDGYLRVQRLPQFALPPIYNELYTAQPVHVQTRSGKWINGVVAGLSVHLQPFRIGAPDPSDLDNVYIDIGANSAAEVRAAGVDNLSPLVMDRRLFDLGGEEFAGVSVGDRFGAAALAGLLKDLDASKLNGTLTVAFVVQQWSGGRGLQRMLSTGQYDELLYVGRMLPGGAVPGVQNMRRAPRQEPGSGVLAGVEQTNGQLEGLASDLQRLAEENRIQFTPDYSAPVLPRSYLPPPGFPAKWAHVGIATAWPDTPAETISSTDLSSLSHLIELYVGAGQPSPNAGIERSRAGSASEPPGARPSNTAILSELVATYGISEHEARVRDEVKKLLPPWAKPEQDDAGNLFLHVGTAPDGAKTPSILIVAHMDEIGYEVKSIAKDGRLEVATVGGGEPDFFLGHPALVHSANGDHDAVMELPKGWDEPKFQWPRGRNVIDRVDVGARSPDEAGKLGIKVGDTVTIPKAYRRLLGTRANGRSFDDRVGDTSLISAAWALGGPLKDRNVTFVFSTGEEIGLDGAAAVAKRLAAEGHAPDYVFAVDTFVSSDSPLESKRFGDAIVGKGFVIRAVDNSNIIRPDLVERVIKLARENQIPAQYGVTGGGNDGSAFVRYGSMDVALGWPLRYSHSPAEVIDTRDVDALARIVTAIARAW